jgi:hypothetical protein
MLSPKTTNKARDGSEEGAICDLPKRLPGEIRNGPPGASSPSGKKRSMFKIRGISWTRYF